MKGCPLPAPSQQAHFYSNDQCLLNWFLLNIDEINNEPAESIINVLMNFIILIALMDIWSQVACVKDSRFDWEKSHESLSSCSYDLK